MAWVAVEEPYAKPPRIRLGEPPSAWSGELALDRGWGELVDVSVGRDSGLDLTGCTELTIVDSALDGVDGVESGMVLEARRSSFYGCDLSALTISSLQTCRFDGCKFTGTDFSGAGLQDVRFERCFFRHGNLRMARLRRVEFIDCEFDDVDCFELEAEDVDVSGSALQKVNVDRLAATRVDLRGATALELTGINSLAGCLIGDHQVAGLAYALIFAVGADIERDDAV